jgi:hypothetical protein
MSLAATSAYSNSGTNSNQQYGALLANARHLIKAGVYPQAAALLQRIIAGAPGTRVAGIAQRMLLSIPTQ